MGPFGELRQWRRSIVSTACATSRALPAILVFCSARGGSAAVAASPSSVGGARGSFFSFDPADWLSSDAAFAMATTGSARILGFPDIGRIAKGAAADLVFLDRGYCHYAPLRQPLRQIVFAETGVAMREVMVSGNFVFQNDRVLTLDEAALGRAAAAAALRLDAANTPARHAAAAATTTIQSFCLGQCRARPWLGRMVAEEDA
jgi:hypothetical protein